MASGTDWRRGCAAGRGWKGRKDLGVKFSCNGWRTFYEDNGISHAFHPDPRIPSLRFVSLLIDSADTLCLTRIIDGSHFHGYVSFGTLWEREKTLGSSPDPYILITRRNPLLRNKLSLFSTSLIASVSGTTGSSHRSIIT